MILGTSLFSIRTCISLFSTFAKVETGHTDLFNNRYLFTCCFIHIHVKRTINIDNFSGFIICDSNYAIFLL